MHRHVLFLLRAGNLDALKMRQEPVGVPTRGHVRVKITHSGLNLADVFACLGLYSATPTGEFTPGLEFSGIVEQVGTPTEETDLQPGDQVWGLSRFGAYASHINADARYLRKIPSGWSLAEAAAFSVQALTAWYGLIELGALHAGQRVLVQSAAGGVGLHALQIIQWKKAHPIAVVGQQNKVRFLEEQYGLSLNQIVLRPSGSSRSAGKEFGRRLDAAGAGLDLVFDAVAGPFFRPSFERLLPGGRYLLFGAADFMPSGMKPEWLRLAVQYLKRYRPDPLSMISDNRAIFGFNLIWLYDRVDALASMLGPMMELPWRRPVIDSIFPAANAIDALQHLKSGRTMGKVLISWDDL